MMKKRKTLNNKSSSFSATVATEKTSTTCMITITRTLQDEDNPDEILNLYICVKDVTATRRYTWFKIDPNCSSMKQDHFEPLTPLCQMPDSTPNGFKTAVLGSKIYTLGGYTWDEGVVDIDRVTISDKVFVCDTLDTPPTWKDSPPMKLQRESPAAAAVNSSLYAIGYSDKKVCQSNPWAEVFDLSTQTWDSLPSPPQGSLQIENSVFLKDLGKILVFSRKWEDSPAYVFDCKTQLWKKIPISPTNHIHVASSRARSVAVGNMVYTFHNRRLFALDISKPEPCVEEVYGLTEEIEKMPKYPILVVNIGHIGMGKMCLVYSAVSSQRENSVLIYCLKFWVGTSPGVSRLHAVFDRWDKYIADGRKVTNCLTI